MLNQVKNDRFYRKYILRVVMNWIRGQKFQNKIIHLAINSYRLGDNIASFPTLKYLISNGKNYGINYKVHVINHHLNDLYRLALPELVFDNFTGSNFPHLTHFAFSNVPTFASNLVDYISFNLAQTSLSKENKTYPLLNPSTFSFDFDVSKSIIISVGHTWENKKFTNKFVEDISEWANSTGYLPVLVGTTNKNFDIMQHALSCEKSINLVDKTNLIELLYLISNSKAVITQDNGILHLSALTKTPIVVGFTATMPEHSLPIRDNIFPIITDVDCKFCAVKGIHTFKSFNTCPYGDYICVGDLKAEKFIKVLTENILNERLT
jgi:ADP-heptose:LPS heptosyltransferase